MKILNITSTTQHDGKTMVMLGLMKAFSEKVKKIGFIKPLGLSERKVADYSIDRDAALIERVFHMHANIKDLNPVTLDKGSLEYFARPEKSKEMLAEIMASFGRISEGCDLMLVKGLTGAACGTVYGLPNVVIAKKMGAKVLLLSSGGIGHPLDQIVMNIDYLRAKGVDVLGVIFNKVFPDEIDKLRKYGASFLEKHGTRLLGVIPHHNLLSLPTIRDIAERINGKVLAGEHSLGNLVGKTFVGAMTPSYAWPYFSPNSLLITGGDRIDMILAVVTYCLMEKDETQKFAGMVLTCGVEPPEHILELLKQAGIPVILAQQDSYSVISNISQMDVRISPADERKISLVADLVKRHVEVDNIFEML